MFLSMINRTTLWELLKIFFLSLVSITGLLMLAGVVKEAQSQGLTPMQILCIIPFIIPSTLPYTIPATTLFATCVVYGRLANDNEILAIRAAGINLLRVIWPALLIGLVTTLVTLVLYFSVIPYSYFLMKTMFLGEIETLIYSRLEKEREFSHPQLDFHVSVEKVQGKRLINPVFRHRNPDSQVGDPVTARAEEAEIMVDQQHNQILIHMRNCWVSTSSSGDNIFLQDKWFPVDFPMDTGVKLRKTKRTDMTWMELLARKRQLEQMIEENESKMALWIANHSVRATPEQLAKVVEDCRIQRDHLNDLLLDVEAELVRRPALAVGCLCFVLIGCPVGIWFSKSDYLSAFVTCFLPIVFIYYPLVLCGENLARTGTLHPVIAIWSANVMFGGVAAVLYWKLLKN